MRVDLQDESIKPAPLRKYTLAEQATIIRSSCERIRHHVFSPYRAGSGPRFRVELFDTNEQDDCGRTKFGYVITRYGSLGSSMVVYAGTDIYSAACRQHADDSDQSVMSVLSFLSSECDYPKDGPISGDEAQALYLEAASRFGIEV